LVRFGGAEKWIDLFVGIRKCRILYYKWNRWKLYL